MLRSLYSRLAITLLILFLSIAALLLLALQESSQRWQDEITQSLHKDLAQHILDDAPLWPGQHIDQAAIKKAFHMMMVLGPAIELYILDNQGRAMAYDAPDKKIKRMDISLDKINHFLSIQDNFPVYAEDPRSKHKNKIFSVAPIKDGNDIKGYLYIIIGGEDYDSLTTTLGSHQYLSFAAKTVVAGIGVFMFVGLIIFYAITSPIRRINKGLYQYQLNNFAEIPQDISKNINSSQDLNSLQNSVLTMAKKIHSQFGLLKRTDQLRKEMMVHLSHDLRTPIAAQRAYLETLLLQKNNISPEQNEHFLKSALSNSDALTRRVDDILELSKLEQDVIQLNLEPFDVGDLVGDLLQKTQALAQQHKVKLVGQWPEKALIANADIGKIERVFNNLLENAIRHTPEGRQVTLTAEYCPIKHWLCIEIHNQGSFINKEDLPLLFQPYFSATTSRQDKRKHFGLGLAISQRLLILHGAELQVRSNPKDGTCFSFDLPLAKN